jgi:hypothetical protein
LLPEDPARLIWFSTLLIWLKPVEDRVMSRKLYSIDYWGHAQRDRRAEKNAAKGAGIGLMGKTLMILGAFALLVIIASALH